MDFLQLNELFLRNCSFAGILYQCLLRVTYCGHKQSDTHLNYFVHESVSHAVTVLKKFGWICFLCHTASDIVLTVEILTIDSHAAM